jgi:hypothetical protein
MKPSCWDDSSWAEKARPSLVHELASLLQLAVFCCGPEGSTGAEALSAALGVACVLTDATTPRGVLGSAIAAVQQLEWVAECAAERRLGTHGKWGALLAVEAVKAVLRLASVAASGRLLLGDVAPSGVAAELELASRAAAERAERLLRAVAAFRSGRARAAGYPAAASLRAPPAPLSPRRARVQLQAGEALRALRPVLYCAAVRRLGRRAWGGWLLALGMDVSSLALLQRTPAGRLEEEELARRRAALALYLLFGPAYVAGVQPRLAALCRACAPLPFGAPRALPWLRPR